MMLNAIKKTPLWKKLCDEIAEMVAEWVKEFMEKEFQDDLRCMIYAQMINKSGEVSNES